MDLPTVDHLSSGRCRWSLNRLQQLFCKATAPSESPSPSACVCTQLWVIEGKSVLFCPTTGI